MPYEWTAAKDQLSQSTCGRLHLWPHRSLSPRGFGLVIGFAASMAALPLIALIGTPVMWALLVFFAPALWGLWAGLRRSYADGQVSELLTLHPDRVELVRAMPRAAPQRWEANPHWVEVRMHPQGGPVEDYLTLKGGGREVEIGAFLSPEERQALAADLRERLRRLR